MVKTYHKLLQITAKYNFRFIKIQVRLDSSGLRLYLTPELREQEIGILTLGSGSTSFDLQMPPKIEDIKFQSSCFPDCFQVQSRLFEKRKVIK